MTGTRKPLRIAMISYYLPSGSKIGVGFQVHEIATELVRRGHQVDVFSDCPPVDGAIYGHRHVKMTGKLRTFRFALALRKIDFSGYDVLHAHGDDYWLWRRRVPRHVRTIHGSCFSEAFRIPGLGEKTRMFFLGLSEVLASIVADKTVVVSPATRKWYPWVRDVIPNGVDTRRFVPAPERKADVPTVLFVGTWSNRKRGSLLAETFVRVVRARIPNAELEMVCRDAPAEPGEGIRVLGALSDAELVEAFQRAWVFALPSSYEGFGIPYVEAMASGVPVVATRNVGARYVTREGRDGLVVSVDRIGEAISAVLTDHDLRRQLAGAGGERVKAFSLERIADLYEQVYIAAR